MSLIKADRGADVATILSLIKEHGYCVIEDAIPESTVDAFNAQIAPHLSQALYGDVGTGSRTRRVGGLIGRAPASHPMIVCPWVLELADLFLGPKATTYQLDCTMLISIEPGEKAQFLHRDELAWDGFPFPIDYPVQLSTIWALNDFTEQNGATRIVPGSHKSDRAPESYTQADTIPAEMKKGSVLLYTGKLVHGGGANQSEAKRDAALINYCVGWVRPDENQFLSVPQDIARTLDPVLQNLMGYTLGAPGLGYTGSFEDPLVALYPEKPDAFPTGRHAKAMARADNLARAAQSAAKSAIPAT